MFFRIPQGRIKRHDYLVNDFTNMCLNYWLRYDQDTAPQVILSCISLSTCSWFFIKLFIYLDQPDQRFDHIPVEI